MSHLTGQYLPDKWERACVIAACARPVMQSQLLWAKRGGRLTVAEYGACCIGFNISSSRLGCVRVDRWRHFANAA